MGFDKWLIKKGIDRFYTHWLLVPIGMLIVLIALIRKLVCLTK